MIRQSCFKRREWVTRREVITKVLSHSLCVDASMSMCVCVCVTWLLANPKSMQQHSCHSTFWKNAIITFFPFPFPFIHSFIPSSLRTRSSLFSFSLSSLYIMPRLSFHRLAQNRFVLLTSILATVSNIFNGERISTTNIIHPCRADGSLHLAELWSSRRYTGLGGWWSMRRWSSQAPWWFSCPIACSIIDTL